MLLPLDSSGRLSGDVVHHTGYPGYLIDDLSAHFVKKVVGQMRPTGRHEINGLDRS